MVFSVLFVEWENGNNWAEGVSGRELPAAPLSWMVPLHMVFF